MSIIVESRLSNSPFIETIMQGHTDSAGDIIRPAENCWHLVLRKLDGQTQILMVGSLTASGALSYTEGADLLWIKFKLGTFMPSLPAKAIMDKETILPEATKNSFWLGDTVWQFPDFENADTFVDWLVRAKLIAFDPLVSEALQTQDTILSARTTRHRFLQITGLSQKHIQQLERAKKAATLLAQGVSILETVFRLGYYDQPHLTRSLKHFFGYTPAQMRKPQ